MNEKVGVFAALDKSHDVFEQLPIFFIAGLTRCVFGILLDGPYGPKQCVGLLHFIDAYRHGLFADEVVDGFGRGGHVFLKAFVFADSHVRPGMEMNVSRARGLNQG